MFQVIPAVDLKDNIVVHGVGGHRDQYQPMQSQFCASASPLDVVDGLRKFYPFKIIYVADLDAIAGLESHEKCLVQLLQRWPDLVIWCDSGLRNSEDIARLPVHPRLRPIAGTETLGGTDSLTDLCQTLASPPVLSLDFKAGKTLGSDQILQSPQCWPEDVIVLNLDHVGASNGPPLAQLETANELQREADRDVRLYAGGGVRDETDLVQLSRQGFAGAVVATALHRGKISAEKIRQL